METWKNLCIKTDVPHLFLMFSTETIVKIEIWVFIRFNRYGDCVSAMYPYSDLFISQTNWKFSVDVLFLCF